MGRYRGPVCRLCRREGVKLYLKGDRCYSGKCAMEEKNYAPGQHGRDQRIKISEFGLQLREKQKARRIYGVFERQFRRYFKEADRRKGVTGEILLQILESRLDNVVYRMGLARSRNEARQLVKHGHFEVNNRKVDIPSYLTRGGDEIKVREKSKSKAIFRQIYAGGESAQAGDWLEVDFENFRGKVVRMPVRDEIDIPISEHFIVELYSK